VKIERAWTWFEMRLLLVVIVSLIAAMVSWVSLKGLSSPVESEARAGTMYRAMLGAIVLGSIAHTVTRRIKLEGRAAPAAVLAAMVLGAGVAPMWRATGVDYFGRMLNWLQEGSSLTMFGGLRGVSTRLTIVLAMVGASLAAANGKHINIDALLRFMRPQLRIVSFVLSSIATIAVCVAAAWGFTDYISIESFGANKDASRGEKISHVTHHLSQDFFLWRKQVGFDLEALPVVVGGGKWDDEKRMNGRQWNEFLDESGYYDHFEKTDVDALRSPEEDLDAPRVPQVVVPDGTARGLLVHALNLIFPIGLLLVAARFFLRMLLVVTGHQSVEVEGELLHSADSLAREDEQATESEPPETKAEAPDAKKSAAKAASAKKSAAKEESADADDGEDAGEGASDDADAPADSDAPAKSDATAEGEPADADGSEDEVKS
jgi:TRAP-type C4-dicarboxylate transport system permease small subunit